ncbi:PATL4 [Linum grandiflorum]
MTVEVINVDAAAAAETQKVEEVPAVDETVKAVAAVVDEVSSKPAKAAEKTSSFREETNIFSDLKDFEKKALTTFKSKLEDAILTNTLFQSQKPKKEDEQKKEQSVNKEVEIAAAKEEAVEEQQLAPADEERKPQEDEKEKIIEECEKKEEKEEELAEDQKEAVVAVDSEISLWGVPLLPSKGGEATDVVLLKFLRARDFKVNEAFEMLRKTLEWRKENKIDSILEEDLGQDHLAVAFYTNGTDRVGHPVCYNVYGVLNSEEVYSKAFGIGTDEEEKKSGKQFLRWRIQQLEQSIQKLELKPGGVASLLQISDLKNSPPPSKKELRTAMKQAVGILQDNYPELVARNIFINVPFWYYAMNALLSPFLTQRTRSKIVVARPAKVTETLLKYISIEQVPAQYGGFKRENDYEFGDEEMIHESVVKAGSTETIEIPTPEVGSGTLLWDVTVVGWEVRYKEEFVPADAGSYTIIIQKERKIGAGEAAIRNSYRNSEAGKVVVTVENCSGKKKKVLYRYKTQKSA